MNHNTRTQHRTLDNTLNSTFKKTQENLNRNTTLYLQDSQTSSQLTNEKIVKLQPVTIQQSISPIHSMLTITYKKLNTPFPNGTLQSTAKLTVFTKYSQIGYQTYRTITNRFFIKPKCRCGKDFATHH